MLKKEKFNSELWEFKYKIYLILVFKLNRSLNVEIIRI